MLRDSCKLIAAQLKDFQKMFHLPSGKKEAIPYDCYTEDNILLGDELIDIDEVKEYFKVESEKEVFEELLQEEYNEGCHNFEVNLDERQFNPVQYYKYYHKHDCITLLGGLVNFRDKLGDFTKATLPGGERVDVWQFVTLSSFADYYCGARSCYFNTYALQSNNRSFVQESVSGYLICKSKFCQNTYYKDFDMVSMYPSAQKRIGEEGGYPMGPAEKIPTHMLTTRPLPYFDYIVRIKITRITKYQIPFVSQKIRGLVKRFNAGELPPGRIVVDKITLEDYVKYCGIEYEVIEGLCWDNEGITECKNTIVLLKELRDEYKRAGNPAQILVKLIMNMGYGKNVLKKADELHVIKELSESLSYISERFGLFKTMTEFGNHAKITMAKYDDHNHIGSMILSMSKRCFHEVLDLCNLLQINVTRIVCTWTGTKFLCWQQRMNKNLMQN